MYRYIAAIWNPQGAEPRGTSELLRQLQPQWSIAYSGPGALVIQAPDDGCYVHILSGMAGAVVGHLFDQRGADYSYKRKIEFDETQSAAIVSSAGRRLVERYWGSYFAIIYDRDTNRHHVLADPIGTLPCYHLRSNDADFFFSNLDDCLSLLPVSPRVNRRFLAAWMLYPSIGSTETALEDVRSLPRGERMTLREGAVSFSRVWDPIEIASRPRFENATDAARELRATVQQTIDAWSSRYQRIVHRVSGGLDSAIIAGCLLDAPSRPQVTYLNLYVEAPPAPQEHGLAGLHPALAERVRALVADGDERYFARLVARRSNTPLIEKKRNDQFDLRRLKHVPITPAPSLYFTMVETDDAELELIQSWRAQAFFSGQAGDSVLLSTIQPLAAMDYAYSHGFKRDLWRHILASTMLSKQSGWSILRKAWRHGLLKRPYTNAFHSYEIATLLSPELLPTLPREDFTSALSQRVARAKLAPGKKNHIEGIDSTFHEYVFHAGQAADHIDPLNSQPIWELMLSIPTYVALDGGVSRGLARQAFADVLPPEIRKRQAKGTGAQFYRQLVNNNRRFLTEQLADGLLVKDGYLDRKKTLECLSQDEPSHMVPAVILMSYLAAELWLQNIKPGIDNISALPQTWLGAVL